MKNKLISLALSALLLISMSCEQDFLDKGPEEDLTIDKVFAERAYAENFLTSAYFNLPEMLNPADAHARNPFTGASDEMEITFQGAISHQLNSGAWNSDYGMPDFWGFNYEGIRKLNIFLENVHKVPVEARVFEEKERQIWIGEATFLRAFYHFLIMRVHGPIPIMDHSLEVDADFDAIRRRPLSEVVDFIVKECDKAAQLLPMRPVGTDGNYSPAKLGRATKAAALALKARVLLYAASPLYNQEVPQEFKSLQNSDGTALFPQSYDPQKWTLAAQAAKEAIDAVEGAGFRLYRSADNDPVKSHTELFLRNWNEEVLFARNLGFYGHFERQGNALSHGGFSILSPTQEHVDAYQMANGESPILGYNFNGSPIINASSGYTEQGFTSSAHPKGYHPSDISMMYVNREPRFYAYISYSGSMWKGRRLEFWNTGIDGRSRGGSDYSISGYLMRKNIDPNSITFQNRFALRTWIFFRVGELYLNYAEALNEAQGPVADVYEYVNRIRERAGLPNLPAGLSKDQMREKIRLERRIELSFETHRYFDTRRWKIAENIDNEPIHGMNILAGTSLKDPAFYNRVVIENRVFQAPKHYLWPLQISEINKNFELVQNPGW
ncbi:RagB/SusD family nutrient uptake outer membrane protein [Rufibacter roseus]|uniref:RagB/SusD family nutrient uptake outer membrane protein n=1 Tax=Rufibacter roseus TaxID=1567108 RepID=A0ABW2DHX6_9BACT|nr:RagB/SusD family nutrient uptake outer membrane protein [Rufibacter roseus]